MECLGDASSCFLDVRERDDLRGLLFHAHLHIYLLYIILYGRAHNFGGAGGLSGGSNYSPALFPSALSDYCRNAALCCYAEYAAAHLQRQYSGNQCLLGNCSASFLADSACINRQVYDEKRPAQSRSSGGIE